MRITPETVAAKLAAIATEHGVPNGAGLDEVAGAINRLAVARVMRWRLHQVNAALAASNFVATYDPNGGAGARIDIRAVQTGPGE